MEQRETLKRPGDFEHSVEEVLKKGLRGYVTIPPPSLFYVWQKEQRNPDAVADILLHGILHHDKDGKPEYFFGLKYDIKPANIETVVTAICDFDFGLTDKQKRFLLFVAIERELAEKKEELAKIQIFESGPNAREGRAAGRQIGIDHLAKLQSDLVKRISSPQSH